MNATAGSRVPPLEKAGKRRLPERPRFGGDPDSGRNGHGVLVWFELDDLDAAVERARALRAQIVEDVHVNPAPGHREMWLRDLDGYLVVICSHDGEAAGP